MSRGSTMLADVSESPASRLDTLPPWPWDDPFDKAAPRTLGYHVWAWAEGGLHEFHADSFGGLIQPNGPRAGQPFQFTPRQRTFLLWMYAVDEQGDWLFSHLVRRLAKGSGKSPFAAILCLAELCAPVRFETFDARQPGGCRAHPVDLPWVQIAATAESQTVNTMRMVRAFAPKGSHIVEHYKLDPGKTKYYKVPEGQLEIITSSSTAAEGAEASFVVGDQTESWRAANGGIDLASTLQDNLAKSGSRMLETPNAWVPGTDTVAEGAWDAWLAQEEGRTRGDTSILYDAVIAPPDTDLTDPESLREALEFVNADCWWVQIRPLMERIWSPTSNPNESKRKYLNWPSSADDAWTTLEDWAQLTDATRVVEDGEEVALFFDGSKSRDATALVGCCISDGHVFTVDVWEPAPAHDTTDVVPVAEVDLTVRQAAERWKVAGFFGDVKEWESFVKITWPEVFPDLEVHAVPTGKDPQAIAWDMRGRTFEFTAAAELTLAEIEDKAFMHDGDSRLARHVANMRNRPNRYGVSVGKESPSSPRKIDAGVCMIGARMVRRLVLAHRAKNQRSPGNFRGLKR